MPDAAKALGVDHVLEGSVRKAGERVRITAQLVRATDEAHLWSETYDRTLQDVLAVQDEISYEVVDALKGQGLLVDTVVTQQ
jgi:TolB-like protein